MKLYFLNLSEDRFLDLKRLLLAIFPSMIFKCEGI